MIKNIVISILLAVIIYGMDFWVEKASGMGVFLFFIAFICITFLESAVEDWIGGRNEKNRA